MGLVQLINMYKEKDLPDPDITLLLDLPAEIAFKRRKHTGATEVFDKDLEFQKKLRQTYLNLTCIYENIITINADRSEERVHKEIVQHYEELISIP